MVLVYNQKLLNELSEDELSCLSAIPITEQNHVYAYLIYKQAKLSPYVNSIYEQFFKFFLTHPWFSEEQPSLLRAMKSNERIKELCRDTASNLQAELANCIRQQGEELDYHSVCIIHSKEKLRSQFLGRVSCEKLNYPQTSYQLNSFIIQELYHPEFDLLGWLRRFYPAEKGQSIESIEEAQAAQCQTLYECITVSDNAPLQKAAIGLLELHYSQQNWMDASFEGAPFIKQVLKNGNQKLVVDHYLSSKLSEKDRLSRLHELHKMYQDLLLPFILGNTYLAFQNPSLLQAILTLYSAEQFYTVLSATKEKERTLLPFLVHLDIFYLFFALLPKRAHLSTLNIKIISEEKTQTVLFDIAHRNPKMVKTVLELIPELNGIVNAKNNRSEGALEIAIRQYNDFIMPV